MPDYRYPLASIYDRYFPPPAVPDERTFEDVAQESGGYAGPPTAPQIDFDFIRNLLGNLKLPQEIATGVGVEGLPFPEEPAQPSIVPSAPREVGLAGVMDQAQESFGPSWKTVPGTQAFTGGPGRYRNETGPYFQNRSVEGLRADEAANSLRAFTAAKYGGAGRYGSAASYMNPLEEAGEARTRSAQAFARRYPQFSVDDIFKQLVEQPQTELEGRLAGPLKELQVIDEAERQRRENAWLLQQYLGLPSAGAPGGVSEKTLKTGTTLAHEKRAQEQLRLSEERLAAMERRDRLARPNEAALSGRAADMLAREKGYAVKRIEGTYYVYKNANSRIPISDSAKVWADARQRAETELRGAP